MNNNLFFINQLYIFQYVKRAIYSKILTNIENNDVMGFYTIYITHIFQEVLKD